MLTRSVEPSFRPSRNPSAPAKLAVPAYGRLMPRVPITFLDSVVYLYGSVEHARKGEQSGGSGFLVGVPVEGKGGCHVYCITNEHVIAESNVIRFSDMDGITIIVESAPARWHRDPKHDLAVLLLADDTDYRDVSGEPFRMDGRITPPELRHFEPKSLLSQETLVKEMIGPGTDVFLAGRFIGHDGFQHNAPAIACGNIAMGTEVVLNTELNRYELSFAIDLRIRSGVSGSPVFVYYPSLHPTPGASKDAPAILHAEGYWWLLGVAWGQLEQPYPVEGGRGVVKVPLGMAFVVPAWFLAALLNDEQLVLERQADAKATADRYEAEHRGRPRAVACNES